MQIPTEFAYLLSSIPRTLDEPKELSLGSGTKRLRKNDKQVGLVSSRLTTRLE